jgi:hypothetical protein
MRAAAPPHERTHARCRTRSFEQPQRLNQGWRAAIRSRPHASGLALTSEPGPLFLLRRQAAGGWPHPGRLQHPEGVHPPPGAASARRHHRALPADPGPQVQPGQDDLPQVGARPAGGGRAVDCLAGEVLLPPAGVCSSTRAQHQGEARTRAQHQHHRPTHPRGLCRLGTSAGPRLLVPAHPAPPAPAGATPACTPAPRTAARRSAAGPPSCAPRRSSNKLLAERCWGSQLLQSTASTSAWERLW